MFAQGSSTSMWSPFYSCSSSFLSSALFAESKLGQQVRVTCRNKMAALLQLLWIKMKPPIYQRCNKRGLLIWNSRIVVLTQMLAQISGRMIARCYKGRFFQSSRGRLLGANSTKTRWFTRRWRRRASRIVVRTRIWSASMKNNSMV